MRTALQVLVSVIIESLVLTYLWSGRKGAKKTQGDVTFPIHTQSASYLMSYNLEADKNFMFQHRHR